MRTGCGCQSRAGVELAARHAARAAHAGNRLSQIAVLEQHRDDQILLVAEVTHEARA